ncbi:MAG: PAS domain S-box protein [Opitutaceae bacterium]|nr:PAS domain S-box protein [Opitutaceae bacterium]
MPAPETQTRSIAELERLLQQRTAELAQARAAIADNATRQRESQTYFEKSFHSSPALMVITRAGDRRIVEANPAFIRASGYTREELVGRTADELNFWAYPAQREEFFRRLKADGVVRGFESALRTRAGAVHTFLVHADPLEVGGVQCLLTVGIDITDRRRREQVQSATYAISQAVLAGGDLSDLFPRLHRIVSGLISAKNFYVAVISPDHAVLSFPYYIDETSAKPAPRKPGVGLTEYVLHTARPLRTTADEMTVLFRGETRYRPNGQPSAVWLGAPLLIDGRAIGVITVQDYHNPGAYTDSDLELLKFVADQAAVAVYRQQIESAQRETRASFEKTFFSSPALMTIAHAADGRLIEVNPAFERGSGYTRAEVIGRTTLELDLWRDPKQRDVFLHRIRADSAIRDFEADFRAKDGSNCTLLLNADLIELGGRPCMLTVAIDVSDRQRRLRIQNAAFQISRAVLEGGALEDLYAKLHQIVSGLMPARNFYVAVLSADGREVSFPYFVDEHVQAPPRRSAANGFTELLLEIRRPLLASAAELAELLQTRGRYTPLERPAAQRLGAPLVAAGRVLGAVALQDYERADAYSEEDMHLLNFVAEQTAVAIQRRQSELALADAEMKYRGIFENALEGLYVTSPDGRFISANPALARMFGYASPAELIAATPDIGRRIYAQPGRRAEFLALASRSDEVAGFESEVRRRDGSTCWISESVRVIRDASGTIERFEGVANDITQRHEAARVLRQAKEAADAASRAKSYFLASVSHELRTPLNGILGYTQILRRDAALTERQREGVRVIHESADHLLALINDVLDLSKIEAGRIDLHPADFDLPEFALGVERAFATRARENGILFETAVAADLPRRVHGDEQRLRQIVFNLVSNAVKFTRTGGAVFSLQRVSPESAVIRFSVSDTGPGISAEDIGKLFEPFAQVGHRAGAASAGTGLGLVISRSLVERMGGSLRVESKPGWGSRFWFDVELPAAASAPAPAPSTSRITGYTGPRRRVLVVDDNAANRAVLIEMLAPLGFEVAEAVDGGAAVERAAEFLPELVLMDLRMPGGVDGLEATRRLRAAHHGAALRIAAVSASAYAIDRTECFAAGCDEFLAKPFREEDLFALVARLLGIEWTRSEAPDSNSPFPQALTHHAPPPAEAAALHDLASKGDVVGLRARAEALLAQDPRHAPFAQNVLDLAARYKMKAVRQFVARYMG